MNGIQRNFGDQGLIRPIDDRVLGGVCAGLGRRYGMQPWPARLLFVLLMVVLPGSPLLIYPILWWLMPSESTGSSPYPPSAYPPTGYPPSQ